MHACHAYIIIIIPCFLHNTSPCRQQWLPTIMQCLTVKSILLSQTSSFLRGGARTRRIPFTRLPLYPLGSDKEAATVLCVCVQVLLQLLAPPTGRRLAELELYILLTKLIPRFTLSTDKDSIALFQGTVLKPNEPVTISISKRLP